MQGTGKAQRVLIVEEDRVEAGIIAFHLRRAGYKPLLVSSSDEATDAVAWGTPNAVVAELGGTGIDGLTFAGSLAGSSLVFVLVADRPLAPGEELEVLRLGLHHVVQKPIDPDALVDRLRRSTPRELGPPAGTPEGEIRGSLMDRSVVELVRLAARHRIDCSLNVASEGPPGWLVVRDGQIIDAAIGDEIGKDAAVNLLLREHGQFALTPLGANSPDLQRGDSVQTDLAELVAEAMTRATPGRPTDRGMVPAPPSPTAPAAPGPETESRPRTTARQVGIPGVAGAPPPPRVTLPDAAEPRPRDLGEPDPEPEASEPAEQPLANSPPAAEEAGDVAPEVQPTPTPQPAAVEPTPAPAPGGNLPWWKPPPLKGFQPPKAAGAVRRRGNRLKTNTKPRVRETEEAPALAPDVRTVRSQKVAPSSASYVRQPTEPPGQRVKPTTQPQGAAAVAAAQTAAGEVRRGRQNTQPGLSGGEQPRPQLSGQPAQAPEMAIPSRRPAGPRISKGPPRVLHGPPRARLKPPPFKRPAPPGPPPAEEADGVPAAPFAPAKPAQRLQVDTPGPTAKKRRGPRRFQTAGRMKAIEPSADLVAAYQDFKKEYGIGQDGEGQPTQEAATPAAPAPVAAPPPATPATNIIPTAPQSFAPPPAAAPPEADVPAPEPAATTEAPAPVAQAPQAPANLEAETHQAAETPTPPEPQVPSGDAALDAAAAEELEKVRGRLVPRSFFSDGERPLRRLRRTSHPNLKAVTADAITREHEALNPAQAADTDPEAAAAPGTMPPEQEPSPSRLSAQNRATDPPFPSLQPPPDLTQDRPEKPMVVVDQRLNDPVVEEEDEHHSSFNEPSITLSGLTAAPPTDRHTGPNLKPVIYALVAVLVIALGVVIFQLATKKPTGQAPKPAATSAEADTAKAPTFDERLGAATLALENSKLAQAEKLFTALVEEKATHLAALSGLAKTLFLQEQWGRAQKSFEELRKLAPEEPNVYWHLTYVYIANGMEKEAKAAAAKFKELSPGSDEAREIQAAVDKP